VEGWPRISTERFDGESVETYRRRSARIVEIVTGFRMGRYADDVAEQRERELLDLQDPGLVLN
jgi:hypothetical protein